MVSANAKKNSLTLFVEDLIIVVESLVMFRRMIVIL